MRNATTGLFEGLDQRTLPTTDGTARIDLGPKFARFVDANRNVSVRVKWTLLPPNGDAKEGLSKDWSVTVDQFTWSSGL